MKCNIENKNIAWSDLDSLINHYKFLKQPPEEGETFSLADGRMYVYTKDNGFSEVKVNGNSSLNLNLYDLNKSAVAQLSTLTNEEIHIKCDEFTKAIHEENKDRYYMLYGKEISYFTLFQIENSIYFPRTVLDCLNEVGEIKAIDLTENEDAIEIWVQPTNEEPTCLYLFPYDNGLVKV